MTDPILVRKQNPSLGVSAGWITRLLFAGCLAFCSEVLIWTDLTRPLWLWLPVLLGYVMTASLILDVLVRYRVYELFGSMVLMGVYALCAGFLMNPDSALNNLPVTLVTRVMGAQFMAGFAALWLFFALIQGIPRQHVLLGTAAITGALWGIWVKGTLTIAEKSLVPTPQLLIISGISLVMLLGLAWWHGRNRNLSPDSLLLNRVEWVVVVILLVGILMLGLVRGAVTREAISPLTLIAVYLGLVIWFQKRQKAGHLLSERLPAKPFPVLWGGIASILFLIAGVLTYQLPPPIDEQLSPFAVILVTFASIGLAWLPTVSLVLGVRSYRQTVRTGGKLL